MNKIMLYGAIQPRDPEILEVNGKKLAKFTLVTKDVWKDGEEWKEHSEWHNIQAWGYLANKCEKLSKGDTVLVEGKSKHSKYTDKNNIEKNFSFVKAESVYFKKQDKQEDPFGE